MFTPGTVVVVVVATVVVDATVVVEATVVVGSMVVVGTAVVLDELVVVLGGTVVAVVVVVVAGAFVGSKFASIMYDDPYHASGFPQQTPARSRYVPDCRVCEM